MNLPDSKNALQAQFAHQLSAWRHAPILSQPVNADFALRVVAAPETAIWQDCPIPDTQIRLLEYQEGKNSRFTALLRLTPTASYSTLGYWQKLEALVLNQTLGIANVATTAGHYVRLPALEHPLSLRQSRAGWPLAADLYVALGGGHFPKADEEPRSIDTHIEAGWLPGPAEGIEVLPLHGHGSVNAMLIRWTADTAFQPQLDPKGEEILVLDGTLADERGRYKAGTWIRNPEISWQHWSGVKDTVVFYKSGHFSRERL
jgi:hypothetical protein